MRTQDCAALVLHPTNEDLFAVAPAWANINTPSGREVGPPKEKRMSAGRNK